MLCCCVGRRHRVPYRAMMENNCAVKIDSNLLPDVDAAVSGFESNGGQLTTFSSFGEDPLRDNTTLVAQRETEFYRQHPRISFPNFFYSVTNGDYSLFREGILSYITITKNLMRPN